MSSKREIIYSVFEKLKISTDDMDITEEFISHLIDTKRAFLIKQRYSRNPWNLPIELKQEVCVDLENVNVIDGMSCFGKILRTKNPLPKSIKIKGKEGPLTVRKYDRSAIHINVVPMERLPFVGHNTFISQMIYAGIDYDNRLYLVSNQKNHHLMEVARVASIFEDPDAANAISCSSSDDTNCEVWDKEYPMEESMLDELVNMIVAELAPTLSIPEDDNNNANGLRSGEQG